MICIDKAGFRLNIFRLSRQLLEDYEPILTSITTEKKPVKASKKPCRLSFTRCLDR